MSPLPLWESSDCIGDAIWVRGLSPRKDRYPSPQPSPTRGEGAHCRCRDIGAILQSEQKARMIRDGGSRMTGLARLALVGLLAFAASGIALAEDALKARIGVLRLSSSAP